MRGLSAPATPGLQLPCGSITDPSQPLRDVEGRRIQRIALSTTRCPNPAARPTGFTNRAGKCRSSRMRYRATNIWHVRPRQEAAASSARPGWDRLNTGGIERNKEQGAGSTVAPGPSSSGNSAKSPGGRQRRVPPPESRRPSESIPRSGQVSLSLGLPVYSDPACRNSAARSRPGAESCHRDPTHCQMSLMHDSQDCLRCGTRAP